MSEESAREVYRVENGEVALFATLEDQYLNLNGEETAVEREVRVASIPEDQAEEIYHALGAYLADRKQGSSGPPGQIPMHQQYANMEPEP